MKKILLSIAMALLLATAVSASQHDYVIANAPGATVRADINSALGAIVTNNSGATAHASTFANQWWYDTSSSILKVRDNANTTWINAFSKSGSNFIPYRNGTLIGTASTLTTDTDTALTANSDSNVATQKATKAYADGKISKTTAGEINALTEKVTLVDNDIVLCEDSASSYAKRKCKKSAFGSRQVESFTNSGSPHSWTVPTGVNYIVVEMISGGGGGGGGRTTGSPDRGGCGGGAGGVIVNHVYKVTPSATLTITVGAGGSGGATENAGANGGTTSVAGGDYTLSITGGIGGDESDASASCTAGGAGYNGNFDDAANTSIVATLGLNGSNSNRAATGPSALTWPGGNGGDSSEDSGRDGGPGGNSLFGTGGNGGDWSVGGGSGPGTTGAGFGSGGGGGADGFAGGAGAGGRVVIMYSVDS